MTAHAELLEGMRTLMLGVGRLLNARLKPQGVSLARLKLLDFIERSRSVRAIDICDAFGFAPRTVTEAIDGLEREALVRRDPDPVDRRAKQISVTPAGRHVLALAAPYRQQLVAQLFEALTPADEAEFTRIVTILNAQLAELGIADANQD